MSYSIKLAAELTYDDATDLRDWFAWLWMTGGAS